MYTIGFDLGSRTTKLVAFNIEEKSIVWSKVVTTGMSPNKTAEGLLKECCENLKISRSEIVKIFSTGYGRRILKLSEKQISEISCHAKGVYFFNPDVRTIIDIGGQDSKVISVGGKGRVLDFAMNDKCAAGTGRFLEKAAIILEADLEEISDLALKSDVFLEISSTCVVFAESEIIGLIAKGTSRENILNAVNHSVAKRVKNLLTKVPIIPPIVFTGGVANNKSMTVAIAETIEKEIISPKNPSITGALGAAIFAAESI